MKNQTQRIQIAIADGDACFRDALASALHRAGCDVVLCADAAGLARCAADHGRGGRTERLHALAIDLDLPQADGLIALRSLGVLCAQVPVVVTAHEVTPALERSAIAHGATLVMDKHERGVDGVVRALRHLVVQHARWSGAWIATGLLARPLARELDDG